MAYMRNIITLLRPHQWLKNLFIFLPLFFSRHLVDWEYIYPCIISFVAYCFAASSVYCFNDIWDVASDRLHPKKCKRPIASGKISKGGVLDNLNLYYDIVTFSYIGHY